MDCPNWTSWFCQK